MAIYYINVSLTEFFLYLSAFGQREWHDPQSDSKYMERYGTKLAEVFFFDKEHPHMENDYI